MCRDEPDHHEDVALDAQVQDSRQRELDLIAEVARLEAQVHRLANEVQQLRLAVYRAEREEKKEVKP